MKSERAKVLHPLLGRPMCAYPIARALEIGASPVVVVVGYQAEEVKSAVKAVDSEPSANRSRSKLGIWKAAR